MTVAIAQYSHNSFSQLPDLNESRDVLQGNGGPDFVREVLGPLFVEHGVEYQFGLALLHRHFDIEPNERLVELNNISTAWGSTDAAYIGGDLLAQSWLFSKDSDELRPYEFIYKHGESSQDTISWEAQSAFLLELFAKLCDLGLEKTLGLRRHPGPDFDGLVEVTVGKSNINFHPSEMSPTKSTETAWFFNPEYITRGCTCKCNQVDPSHGHKNHVSSR